jgi:membrane protein DedA with SNARE-associated domain/rhodanese-related sulfurtransferase
MGSLLGLLEHHTLALIFGWVLVEQAGVPLPSVPLMLAAGTLSAAHKFHVAYAIPVIMLACLISDSMWYLLGKRYGRRVLNMLCRFSLEADACVTKTQGTMGRRGPVTLLFAKFVPGLSTMAAPIAGQAKMRYWKFALYDMGGTLIWAGAWLFVGRFFGDLAKRSSEFFGMLGHFGALLILLMVVGVVFYRLLARRRFKKELRVLRLEPGELREMMEEAMRLGAEMPFIVDLRHPLDVLTDPWVLHGALRIGPEELKLRRELIPHDRDVVLYCTCPSEETSAKVAMELRRMGVQRVRPLRGGLQGWRDAGYPVDMVEVI